MMSPVYDTHLCLVSDQATPNLLPVMDERYRPRRVVLAVSQKMQAKAQALEQVLRSRQVQVERLALSDPFDYTALVREFEAFLAHTPSQASVALNVTGGTKLMAVAAQEMFQAEGRPVFYVNIENDEVLTLGTQAQRSALSAKFKIGEYLKAHGYTVTAKEAQQPTAYQRDTGAHLLDMVSSHGHQLGQLNWLASRARGVLHVDLTPEQADSLSLHELLDTFADGGFLVRQRSKLSFASEEARFFVNGGWLEYQLMQAVNDLRGQGISDVAMNLKVTHPDGSTTNELDVAFMYRNTLHVIECKTANLAQPGTTGDDRATEAIYKMESLLKLGGLRTRGMIVDYRGTIGSSPALRKRAELARIELLSGRDLRNLKGQMSQRWLGVKAV
jgi:hypothetical protein